MSPAEHFVTSLTGETSPQLPFQMSPFPYHQRFYFQQDKESWKIVFIMAATVHFIGVTFYAIFASGDLQPWAEPTDEQVKAWTDDAPRRPSVPPQPVLQVTLFYSKEN